MVRARSKIKNTNSVGVLSSAAARAQLEDQPMSAMSKQLSNQILAQVAALPH